MLQSWIYLALALLIYFDVVLTYAAVKALGAVEVVLVFANQWPESLWLVAAGKNAGVLYLFLKRRRYKWVDYAAAALSVWHAVVLANGVAQFSAALAAAQ